MWETRGGVSRRRRGLASGLVTVAVVLIAGCTGGQDPPPEPAATPPPTDEAEGLTLGLTIAVVLPPEDETDTAVLDAMAADVTSLGASLGPEVREIRAHVPPSAPFVTDFATMLAERGTDLVCVLGPRGRSASAVAADLHPEVRWCTAPASPPPPPGGADGEAGTAAGGPGGSAVGGGAAVVTRVEVESATLGHVVGAVARAAALGTPVGVVTGRSGARDAAFRDGMLAALHGVEVVERVPEPGQDPVELVDELLASGAEVVVIEGIAGASQALAHAVEQGARVLGPSAALTPVSAPGSVLSWRVRWNAVLRGPVDLLLGERPPRPPSLGFAQEVLSVEPGAAAPAPLRLLADELVASFATGERDPLEPAAPAPPPSAPTG